MHSQEEQEINEHETFLSECMLMIYMLIKTVTFLNEDIKAAFIWSKIE